MTRNEHILTILAEECAEVAKECSKAIRFGLEDEFDGPSVKERLEDELCDLFSVCGMISAFGLIDPDRVFDTQKRTAKIAKVNHYLRYSAERGTLQEEGENAPR